MSGEIDITVTVNGHQITAGVFPRLLLSDFLRDSLGLTATHVGCEHGVCGACTILFDGQAARSCLMFAVQIDGHDVWTLEGLSETGAVADLQEAFGKYHALQCGYCTPGMLIVAHDFLNSHPSPTADDIRLCVSVVGEDAAGDLDGDDLFAEKQDVQRADVAVLSRHLPGSSFIAREIASRRAILTATLCARPRCRPIDCSRAALRRSPRSIRASRSFNSSWAS